MKSVLRWLVISLAVVVTFLAGSLSSRTRAAQAEAYSSPVVGVWGSKLAVYYPDQKRLYVYSELGGNCVFSYTLTTPGGAIARENCK